MRPARDIATYGVTGLTLALGGLSPGKPSHIGHVDMTEVSAESVGLDNRP